MISNTIKYQKWMKIQKNWKMKIMSCKFKLMNF